MSDDSDVKEEDKPLSRSELILKLRKQFKEMTRDGKKTPILDSDKDQEKNNE